jgi:Cft2 family RNA processing exonuclease
MAECAYVTDYSRGTERTGVTRSIVFSWMCRDVEWFIARGYAHRRNINTVLSDYRIIKKSKHAKNTGLEEYQIDRHQ